ncbi:PAS domain-containing protein [Acetobacteraceae bacterium H6797]|nr:PAS domain-containing protein [Acetobacteraceae bacterium H6797]
MLLFEGPGEVRSILRAIDWSATPMGPVASWPRSLSSTIKLLLGSRYPMVLLWGREDLVQVDNDAYTKLIGTKHPQALGRSIKLTQAESWQTIGPMIERVIETGEPNWVPAQLLAVNRFGFVDETYFSLSYSPVEDDEGAIQGMLCVCSEVTPQTLAQRRLQWQRDLGARSAEARHADAVCDGLAAVLRMAQADIPFAMLHLREEEGAFARKLTVAPTPEGEASLARLAETGDWLARAASGEAVLIEQPDLPADLHGGPWGEPVRAALAQPLTGGAGAAPLGVLLCGISPNCPLDENYRSFLQLFAAQLASALRNARAYEDERRRAEALAALDRAKTTFFSNVSHEFRTPLTLILGPLEDALAAPPADLAAHREPLEVARRNALRMLRLVNTLLDFSRMEEASIPLSPRPTDLAALTADLASAFRTATDRAGLALALDCPPLPRPVMVDPEIWEKIVLNLLSNSFKFTAEGGIAVSLHGLEEGVRLTIADTGAGIPSEALPRLFERFFRIEGQWSRSHEGSGIGLALVRELVELHGGRIEAESDGPGRGSAFHVFLPYGEAAAGAVAGTATPRSRAFVEEALRWLPDEAEAPLTPPLGTRPRLLVIDDNADMRLYLKRLLLPAYEVLIEADGAAGLEALRRFRPDLVLSDVMMPGVDGMSLLASLRADPATAATPVILLSARAGEDARAGGLAAGADDYLVKPFGSRELLARIEGVLRLSAARAVSARIEAQVELRAIADALPVIIAQVGPDLRYRFVNATYESWFGTPRDTLIGRTMLELIGEKAFEMVRHRLEAALRGEAVTYKASLPYRLGGHRDVQVEYVPRLGNDGQPDGFYALVQDITAQEQAARHRELLVNELNHRVKNTLTVVQAIAGQSFRDPRVPPSARETFEGRVAALARTHDLLTSENWDAASLSDIVRGALAPFGDWTRVQLDLPNLRLGAKAAESLSLALHELATNACKYGALSVPDGRLSLTAGIGERFWLEWRESGGPPVAEPQSRGFGSRLVEHGLAAELGGEVKLLFLPAGLVCRIEAPLAHVVPSA